MLDTNSNCREMLGRLTVTPATHDDCCLIQIDEAYVTSDELAGELSTGLMVTGVCLVLCQGRVGEELTSMLRVD